MSTTTSPGLAIRNLVKRFGDNPPAVDDVSIEVPPGSFLVLLGPSGCGKTTILRMLAGLETPTSGSIAFGDRSVVSAAGEALPPARRGAGLVFQSYALWPHMTVQANVEWPLKVAKMPARERKLRVAEVLDLLGIGSLAKRYPGEISGGQQQRVAIARMIGPAPSVLLFDEPLSNLDAKLRVETRAELMRIHRATGATSVYVTHDQVEAMTMATHVALLRDGRVEQFGHPHELLANPTSSFVATFVGTPPANVVRGVVDADRVEVDGVAVCPPPRGAGRDHLDLLYRAEALDLVAGDGPRTLRCEFSEATPLAGRWVVACHTGSTRLSVVVDEEPRARLGDTVWVRFPEEPEAVFDIETGARVDAGVEAVAS